MPWPQWGDLSPTRLRKALSSCGNALVGPEVARGPAVWGVKTTKHGGLKWFNHPDMGIYSQYKIKYIPQLPPNMNRQIQ